jgi:hypothetical protein
MLLLEVYFLNLRLIIIIGTVNTTSNVGTAATSVTAVEKGDGSVHETILTVTALSLIDPAANAALAGGALVYTFPAGDILVLESSMSISLDEASGSTNAADTPDLGLGTVVGSGVQSVLSGVGATSENILTGQTASDVNAAYTTASVATALRIASASVHTVYLNIADTWAGDGAAILATGTIRLKWIKL